MYNFGRSLCTISVGLGYVNFGRSRLCTNSVGLGYIQFRYV
jgi:hypothetical protein